MDWNVSKNMFLTKIIWIFTICLDMNFNIAVDLSWYELVNWYWSIKINIRDRPDNCHLIISHLTIMISSILKWSEKIEPVKWLIVEQFSYFRVTNEDVSRHIALHTCERSRDRQQKHDVTLFGTCLRKNAHQRRKSGQREQLIISLMWRYPESWVNWSQLRGCQGAARWQRRVR